MSKEALPDSSGKKPAYICLRDDGPHKRRGCFASIHCKAHNECILAPLVRKLQAEKEIKQ